MAKSLAKLLTWASVVACLFVAVSFLLFAVNQTSSASAHQQEAVSGESVSSQTETGKEGGVRKAIDDAANQLTSPFSSITSGSSNEWVVRGVGLLCALIVYGFGLGYIARVIRVRV